ncbi:MAG: AraC family transcriptional regulator [Flavobacteriaceae bacterium]
MKLRLNINDLPDIIFEYGAGHTIKEGGFYNEKHYNFDYNGLKAGFTEIITDHLRITYGNGSFGNRTRLDFDFIGETVEMHFTLKGSSLTTIEGHLKEHRIDGSGHNLFYCKDIKGHMLWESPEMFIFEINLRPDFFSSYLPEDSFFDSFKNALHNGDTCYLHPDNYPITAQMKSAIQEIIHCRRKGLYKKMFLESKVMELLLLQLEQINEHKSTSTKSLPSKLEIEKMKYAQEIIQENLLTPLSLYQLSKLLNTNECSLKKSFKAVYGTTVFGYIQELKMKEAKTLICDQKLPVYQVADKIGYKNPQHFTAAFKKYFGYVPSKLIR